MPVVYNIKKKKQVSISINVEKRLIAGPEWKTFTDRFLSPTI
jgi:hypothetical protein